MQIDPTRDLILARDVGAPPTLVWRALTEPRHLARWFAPQPWSIVRCEIDLRPGGLLHFVMRSPEGEEYPNSVCYLEVVPNQRLIWTDALEEDYRPSSAEVPFHFTAAITLEARGSGTHYRAIALHPNAESRGKHEEMGFHDGWGRAFDQMVELLRAGLD